MIEAAWILGAYLIGAVPFGVIVARSKGVDLFSVGSGNIGATNVTRTLGKGPGLLVFALDVLKGAAPALAARWYFQSPEWALGIGCAAIAGHCLSPFLRFRGGKGIATGLGMLIGATPLVAASAFGIFALVLWISRWVSLASILAVASTVFFGWLYGDSPWMLGAYSVLLLFVIYRHRANIRRLKSGEEPKFRWNRRKNQDSEDDESNKKDMSAAANRNTPNPTPFGMGGGSSV